MACPARFAGASDKIGADGLKPLNVIHRPTDNSQKKIGIVAMPVHADWGSLTPNIVPIVEENSSGAPISPPPG